MSGGNFNVDFRLYEAIDIIELELERGTYSPEVVARFKLALETVRRAKIMLHRIDYLIDGDDGEETFLQKWDEELAALSEAKGER